MLEVAVMLRLFFACALITILAPGLMVLSAPPRLGGPVLVVLPPWVDADSTLRAAGGQAIGPAAAPFAVLAQFESATFEQSLRAQGAWAVRDGTTLARLCGAT